MPLPERTRTGTRLTVTQKSVSTAPKIAVKKAAPTAEEKPKAPASPEKKKAQTLKELKGFLNSGAPSFTRDRDGTSRYKNNQNAAYLKNGAPPPAISGNGQNAAYLKNGGGNAPSSSGLSRLNAAAANKNAKNGGTNKTPKDKPDTTDDDKDIDTKAKSPPPPPPPPIYNNKDWTKVVGHYFPEKQMKAGGLVRGGGAASKGRGRGKIV